MNEKVKMYGNILLFNTISYSLNLAVSFSGSQGGFSGFIISDLVNNI